MSCSIVDVLMGDIVSLGPGRRAGVLVDFKNPVWNPVLSTRPGITDLASLVYRNEEEILEAETARDLLSGVVPLPSLELICITAEQFDLARPQTVLERSIQSLSRWLRSGYSQMYLH